MVANFDFDRWMFKLRKLFEGGLPSTVDWYELWENGLSPQEAQENYVELSNRKLGD